MKLLLAYAAGVVTPMVGAFLYGLVMVAIEAWWERPRRRY